LRGNADGRLLEARTSNDGRIWERDARYFYARPEQGRRDAHGPLARTELGDKSVQGTDHYYTLHGWLRGVNSPTLQRAMDPGTDGSGQHLFFADDANSYALGYFTGDFVPVAGNSASPLPANGNGAYAAALAQRDLYNGNIPTMLTALRDLSGGPMPLHANVYRYDRLNRIKGMDVYHGAPTTDLSALANNDDYRTAYSYDPNGNLLTLSRNAHGSNRDMDRFTYHYTAGTNQLEYVDDTQPAANWPDDLDEQNLGNYAYDLKGRLTKDVLAGIGEDGIVWTLHDKVRAVTRTDSDLDELHFRYGPMGHRTVKEVRPRTGGNTTQEDQWTTTYYIHDAQGNPMAIYRRSYQPTQGGTYRDQLVADGLPVYGSARLGMNQRPSLYRPEFSITGFAGLHFAGRSYTQMPSPWVADDEAARTLGHKAYELANHLGNVLTTVSDRRMAVPDAGNPSLLESYMADVRSVSDYYPFGSLLPGRVLSSNCYRYSYNGMENASEVAMDIKTTPFRELDTRIGGRWWSRDPIVSSWESPYVGFADNPVFFIDPWGLNPGGPVNPTDAQGIAGSIAPNGGVRDGQGSVFGGEALCKRCGPDGSDIYGLPDDQPALETIAKGSLTNFSQQVFRLGSDFSMRKYNYHNPYMYDLVSNNKTNAQIAADRLNRLAQVRLQSSPLGRALAQSMKTDLQAKTRTLEIIRGERNLGLPNAAASGYMKYALPLKALGIVGLSVQLAVAADNIHTSDYNQRVVMKEVGGLTGALLWGSMGATYGAMIGGPFAPITALGGGLVGGAIGYWVGSGEMIEDTHELITR
jgi:hypothetical protein